MHCFHFFRNQLKHHLISFNSFRYVNMCLLEVATEKCRTSHFAVSERGEVSLRTGGGGLKNSRYCTFVPPPLLLLMIHHEETQLNALP